MSSTVTCTQYPWHRLGHRCVSHRTLRLHKSLSGIVMTAFPTLLGSFDVWVGNIKGGRTLLNSSQCGSTVVASASLGPFVAICGGVFGQLPVGEWVTVNAGADWLTLVEIEVWAASGPSPAQPPTMPPVEAAHYSPSSPASTVCPTIPYGGSCTWSDALAASSRRGCRCRLVWSDGCSIPGSAVLECQ